MPFKYFVELSYDGSEFHGWQIQRNAKAIQEVLQTAFGQYFGQMVHLTGCGRTDTGVHARQFFAHFELSAPIENASSALHHLNAMIPRSIALLQFHAVSDEASARFSATSRTYEYSIINRKDPFAQGRRWHLHTALNTDAMNTACELLKSHTDFGCFAKSRNQSSHYVCHISHAHWDVLSDGYLFTVSANRFLRNMVRAMVGTLVEVGEGVLSLDDFSAVLLSNDRRRAGQSVPAHGLYLTQVSYPAVIFI